MRYAYYPGCSLTESAVEFDVSTRAVMARLGAELDEIPDWTCCGASAAEPVSKLLGYALPARNLAIAEKEMGAPDVLAPCSACYLNLLRVNREVSGDRRLNARVNEVLLSSGLTYSGGVRVRHLLDVLINDVGVKIIAQHVRESLSGLKVAPYYGCQILRPYPVFDDPRRPVSMNGILEGLGAEVHEWDHANKCCGASLMMGHPEVAQPSVTAILKSARRADVIVTVCPLCQMNLEAYQAQARKQGARAMPVLYLTQLMGLAFGLGDEALLLDKNLTVPPGMRRGLADRARAAAAGGDGETAEERKETPSKEERHV